MTPKSKANAKIVTVSGLILACLVLLPALAAQTSTGTPTGTATATSTDCPTTTSATVTGTVDAGQTTTPTTGTTSTCPTGTTTYATTGAFDYTAPVEGEPQGEGSPFPGLVMVVLSVGLLVALLASRRRE